MITHGHTSKGYGSRGTPTYRSYRSMLARCLYPKHVAYHNYGGRGILICQRWLGSFSNFLADMGERPPGLYLDRIDSEGHYEPSNCRWATMTEQARNKRPDPRTAVVYQGELIAVTTLARQIGMSHSTLDHRIRNLKWTVEDATTIPVKKGGYKPRRAKV